MSRELTDLLESTTPNRPPDTDYEMLAARGRRRRWGKRAGAVAVMAAVVVAVVVAVEMPDGGPGAPDVADRPGPTAPAGDPATPDRLDADEALDAVGEWDEVAGMPAGPRVAPFAGQLDDGRLLVFTGMNSGIDGQRARRDGVVIDPTDGTTEPMPDAPLAGPVVNTALADGRLLALTSTGGAIYDTADGAWTALPDRPGSVEHPRVVAYNGQTLIIGAASGGDTQPDGGRVLLYRWDHDRPEWQPLPPAPVEITDVDITSQAFNGQRLALAGTPTGGGSGVAAVVYEVTDGRWSSVPDRLLPDADEAHLAWIDGGLAVVPAQPHPDTIAYPRTDEPQPVADPVVIDIDKQTAQPLAPIPEPVRDSHFRRALSEQAVSRLIVGRGLLVLHEEISHTARMPQTTALLSDGTWTDPLQARELAAAAHTVVATSVAGAFPNLTPLEAAVWTEEGWAPADDTDAHNRSGAAVVGSGDGIYIVGGWSVRQPATGEQPDARPSEPDEPGPYMIDLHDTILKLTLPG